MHQTANNQVEPSPPPAQTGKGKTLAQFASLAVMTQGVLLLNQILLLPIQLRVWGTDLTAYWLSVMAVAAATQVMDFGLRAAGHAELIRHTNDPSDHEAGNEFAKLWAWMRILMLLSTVVLVVADYVFHHFCLGMDYPLWRTALLLGYALEVAICVRVNFLDTQGFYREAEAGYLVLAGARLFLAVGALLIFGASPAVLAYIWFFTGVFALAQQSLLCRKTGHLKLFAPLPHDLSIRTLATVRHTMADPCANWVRFNLPVLVLSAIAAPIAVVMYGALRAIFGAGRATILQMSRYASVEYLALRQARRNGIAEMHLIMMVLLAAFFASGMAALVIADNGRLASLMVNKIYQDLPTYQMVAVTFGMSNAFFAYQITAAVSRRAGEVAEIAHRQYFYILACGLFAVPALILKSMLLWLVLMLVADVLMALTFLIWPSRDSILRQTSCGWRGAAAAATSSTLVFVMWLTIHFAKFSFLTGRGFADILCTIAFFLAWILLIGFVDLSLASGLQSGPRSLLLNLLHRFRAPKLQNE